MDIIIIIGLILLTISFKPGCASRGEVCEYYGAHTICPEGYQCCADNAKCCSIYFHFDSPVSFTQVMLGAMICIGVYYIYKSGRTRLFTQPSCGDNRLSILQA